MLISPIASIMNREEKKAKLNILLFCTDPLYEVNLCKTGHNFYSWTENYELEWPKELPVPINYEFLPPQKNIPINLCFDFVLAQARGDQFELANNVGHALHIPKLVFNNLLPSNYPPEFSQRVGDADIFAHSQIREAWHVIGTEIEHAPTELNQEQIDKAVPYVMFDSPKLDELKKMVDIYPKGNVFINILGPSVMQSTINAENQLIITHGKNGFLCNSLQELLDIVNLMIAQPDVCRTIGQAAYDSVKDKKLVDFVEKWNQVFEDTRSIIYVR